ncbi:MAG: EF-P beta-lysylation protein EpmB [Gammaproteobacteria bacterium]|nr:EF-P beta-lysylation protein EpmB [Gammaproteobacteria bacterium]
MSQLLPTHPEKTWQEELIDAVRDPALLLQQLDLPVTLLEHARLASRDFSLKVPHPFLQRMRKGDINDPLLRQVLPLAAELEDVEGYSTDPLQEQAYNAHSGMVHKYRGRVLLIVAPNCAVNCRYCFRRHFPYQDNNPGRQQWQQVFAQLRADQSISEVIFSGGDPLASPDRHLQWLVDSIAAIPHIRRLRVHTRLPVVIPQRITTDTLGWLAGSRLHCSVVLHINHRQELDAAVGGAIAQLRDAGITVLNQSVLLKGVNDCAQTLAELSEALFEQGVLPYYLHLLDRVQGAAHFGVDEPRAIALHRQLQARLPGYLVPRLARDDAGASGKTLVS